tara:strand:+ start:130 stop:765 length:636 start_codon:yes stop_codon:yes gene_type:complete
MNNIIYFPENKKSHYTSKKRVFRAGFRYLGPPMHQELQHIFLKRGPRSDKPRIWSIIIYEKNDMGSSRKHPIEIEKCQEDELPNVLRELEVIDKPCIDELREMGWRGKVFRETKIRSIFHKCYNRIKFPKFVTPLKTDQFNGTKIMSESRGARNRLNGKGLYAFTHYRNEYPNGHVWMNLNLHNSEENEAVPVKPITKFTKDFYKTYFVNQ